MKKMISVLLALFLIVALLPPMPANAEHTMSKVGQTNPVVAGGDWSGIIDTNGKLWLWGDNNYWLMGSQRGGNATYNVYGSEHPCQTKPVQVLEDAVSVSGSNDNIFVLRSDSSLWSWGSNGGKQLGEDILYATEKPVKVMEDVVAFDGWSLLGNVGCICAVKSNGSLWMRGTDRLELTGKSSTLSTLVMPVKLASNVIAVSQGMQIAIIKADGSLWIAGPYGSSVLGGYIRIENGPYEFVKKMDHVAAVSVSSCYGAAIKTDGSLWTWGSNERGTIGIPTISESTVVDEPVKVMDDVIAVSHGGSHVAAIKKDGSLWTWGSNQYGQLGNGGGGNASYTVHYSDIGDVNVPYQTVPVKVADNMAAVCCGSNHTVAVAKDGTVWTWGNNDQGQLGNGTQISSAVPIRVEGLTAQMPSNTLPYVTLPTYTFPAADSSSDNMLQEAVNAVLNELNGSEPISAYLLSDGLYYILFNQNGNLHGCAVKGMKENGKLIWKVVQTDAVPAEEESLIQFVANEKSTSNLSLDYGKLTASATVSDVTSYIQERLDNIDGLTLNDPGKNELSAFMESALSVLASKSVSSSDNRLVVSTETITELLQQIQSSQAEFNALLTRNNTLLNKTLDKLGRLLWQDVDLASPCQITLDENLAAALDGCTLQIMLGNNSTYVQISADDMDSLGKQYGAINLQISKDGNLYTVSFLDQDAQLIEQINAPVTLALPASGPLNTVMLSYANGSDNWGGQYDANTGTLSFATQYSGQYEVLENNVDIKDIDNLAPEVQEAIRFLVSKGYMSLEDGLFQPELLLTRYDFTQALVGMFFSLDRGLTSSFPDVPAESPYYAYVASGESNNLLSGLPDGTFGGESYISTEQMLTIAARSLVEKKGYLLPENSDYYLNTFQDSSKVGEWASSFVALAVRDGLITLDNDTLNPQGDVNREQAAVILYRLFLDLYEVPPVALDLPSTTEVQEIVPDEQGSGAPLIALIAVAIGGVATGTGFFIYKKKQK